MDSVNRSAYVKITAAVVAIIVAGFAVHLLLVHVQTGIDVPTGCELESDFWNGDQILC